MSVDELLTAQSTQCFMTLERVPDQPDLIKLTPWVSGRGCMCHRSLKVPKSSIEWVSPTEHTHACCGKTFMVVQVEFAPDSTIPLTELFQQWGEAPDEPVRTRAVRQTHDLAAEMYDVVGTAGRSPRRPSVASE